MFIKGFMKDSGAYSFTLRLGSRGFIKAQVVRVQGLGFSD